jgi:hypothetical protein
MSIEQIRERILKRLQEQRELTQSLLRQREQLGGSLFVRYGACGKEACTCRHGRGHGPYYVFSTRSGGSGSFVYLSRDDWRKAKDLVARSREFRRALQKLRKVNMEVTTLLRRYQSDSSRSSARGLGLPASLNQKP